ncbi:NTP transferase domain-containing protein [Hymenobacter lutimineralis]|uniref:NTP transferase domain-containing protein n=1 Tax=Hymenobacter lutimineralis TaxID=2606448 RepID=A0A5D6VDU5_9BACT|nr:MULTISPECIES: sugar phosphate nucleotidyltransferase [Hymenobacter]QIX61239.1 NTP transferase domain-containing protein [Hymenobacter sp. BT18]TYZ13457.1 NTP transferase domain-containing protein [Hymenobacter lutimineralis]
MKAVIPVAGIGTRLRPHTHTQPKSLVPIAGTTILGHIIDRLLSAGIDDFVFIIGYLGEKVERYVRRQYPELQATFVVQEPREGIGQALWLARDTFRHEEGVLILLGDTIVDIDLPQLLRTPGTVLAVKEVKTPTMFGLVETGAGGRVTKVVEKPRIPKSNYAMVGLYKIANPALLAEALEQIVNEDQRTHGEFQLTDALMRMIQQGETITTTPVDNWFDCGRKETLLEANARLLNRPEFLGRREYPEFPDTIIIPPVSIGRDCQISHAIIGPNVAIGDRTIVKNTILSDAIIGSYSELRSAVLHDCIVGSDASFRGMNHSLNIGDNTEIDYS